MSFVEVSEQPVHLQRVGRFLVDTPGGKTQGISLLPQSLKRCAHLCDGQQRPFKVDAAGLASLRMGASIGLLVQFIAQGPLLKNGATKLPERAVAREHARNGLTSARAGIGGKAVNQLPPDGVV